MPARNVPFNASFVVDGGTMCSRPSVSRARSYALPHHAVHQLAPTRRRVRTHRTFCPRRRARPTRRASRRGPSPRATAGSSRAGARPVPGVCAPHACISVARIERSVGAHRKMERQEDGRWYSRLSVFCDCCCRNGRSACGIEADASALVVAVGMRAHEILRWLMEVGEWAECGVPLATQ
jgi:hypothetical protein